MTKEELKNKIIEILYYYIGYGADYESAKIEIENLLDEIKEIKCL